MQGTRSSIKALGGEGILVEKDLDDFQEAEKKLYDAFMSGRQLTVQDMRAITKQDQGDRRMRSLRAKVRTQGYDIIRMKDKPGGRKWLYCMIVREPEQQRLL